MKKAAWTKTCRTLMMCFPLHFVLPSLVRFYIVQWELYALQPLFQSLSIFILRQENQSDTARSTALFGNHYVGKIQKLWVVIENNKKENKLLQGKRI